MQSRYSGINKTNIRGRQCCNWVNKSQIVMTKKWQSVWYNKLIIEIILRATMKANLYIVTNKEFMAAELTKT